MYGTRHVFLYGASFTPKPVKPPQHDRANTQTVRLHYGVESLTQISPKLFRFIVNSLFTIRSLFYGNYINKWQNMVRLD